MVKVKELNDKELKNVVGGKYYGNGVSCNKKGCTVNWGQAWTCGVNRFANYGHGKC
ncbi:bacteriocin [Pediococcus stilesii]|uniref:Bacteriocin n=1 Tax=Pediococcus stilesii TaxID=331679 RepID=A0A5R9BUP3_9LACO|nr:leucocin A/sakacin P family class II bacteriocin [Pediococcus stilesii]TLQ04438.1 bacteriocin [Pediococcus stilesii]